MSSAVEAVVEIQNPQIYSRVIAVSDLHGRSKASRKLMQALGIASDEGKWIGGKSLVVVIGDSVAKGDHTIKLLRYWMELEKQAAAAGGRLIHTLGNHEARLIATPDEYLFEHPEITSEMEEKGVKSFSAATNEGKFLRKMPVAVRAGNVLFIHSGTVEHTDWEVLKNDYQKVFDAKNYKHPLLSAKKSVLEIKMYGDYDQTQVTKNFKKLKQMGIHTVVFGHEPGVFLDDIRDRATALKQGSQQAISIDFGMGGVSDAKQARAILFTRPKTLTQKTLDLATVKTSTEDTVKSYFNDEDFCLQKTLRKLLTIREL
jgi:hypothetical protein